MASKRFHFRALDTAGNQRDGILEVTDRLAALSQLSTEGLIPVELREASAQEVGAAPAASTRLRAMLGRQWRNASVASSAEWLQITQTLGALLESGLTVDRALGICVLLAPSPACGQAVREVLEKVRRGETLSDAIRGASVKVPAYYYSMLQAGEVGGAVATSLIRIAELMQAERQIRERVVSALIYPLLLSAVVIVTLIVVVTFVLPRFDALFSESQTILPLSTRVVLAVGRFVASYGWLLALLVMGVGVAVVMYLRTPKGRARLDMRLARSGGAWNLPAAINTARLLRTVGTLCSNGATLLQALRTSHGTVANRALHNAVERVIRQVQAGQTLSASLAAENVFPAVAVQMARVGEETGNLSDMLLSAAKTLESDSQRRMERLLTLMVPIMTIAMGMIVAGLIGSVLIGLLSVNDVAL